MDPSVALAGEAGTWVLRYTVGATGIQPGGGIRVQLPNSWHVGRRNSAKGVHSEDPTAPNFVSAISTRSEVQVSCLVEGGSAAQHVKRSRTGLDGRMHRYAFVVRVTIAGQGLREGDQIHVVFGDRSSGSLGFTAGFYQEGPEVILVAVDPFATDSWEPLSSGSLPRIEIVSGEVSELLAIAPSVLRVGETAQLHVRALDPYGNRVDSFAGTALLRTIGGDAGAAQEVRLQGGSANVPIRPRRAGVLRFDLTIPSEGPTVISNPVVCVETEPAVRLFWGDLHAHADASSDGTGGRPFEYASEVSALDFVALTDHAERWPTETWDVLRERVKSFYEPGRFVTLLAYEATFGSPWGHHNVYFRSEDGPVLGADRGTLLDLWSMLTTGGAITVPHHTGVCFSPTPEDSGLGELQCPSPDWQHHHPELRRLVEIYSGHGLSERFDPAHRLSYENCRFSFDSSVNGPHYVWDAWRRGHRLGVVASSDDHHGQPGRGEFGVAGVWAAALTREAVFDSLASRQTFGTTGCRTIVWVTVDDAPMGQEVGLMGSATVRLEVHATTKLERIEVIVGNLASGAIEIAHSWETEEMDFEADWTDSGPPKHGFYYVRVTQRGEYRGRILMAWSSPVWVHTTAGSSINAKAVKGDDGRPVRRMLR